MDQRRWFVFLGSRFALPRHPADRVKINLFPHAFSNGDIKPNINAVTESDSHSITIPINKAVGKRFSDAIAVAIPICYCISYTDVESVAFAI